MLVGALPESLRCEHGSRVSSVYVLLPTLIPPRRSLPVEVTDMSIHSADLSLSRPFDTLDASDVSGSSTDIFLDRVMAMDPSVAYHWQRVRLGNSIAATSPTHMSQRESDYQSRIKALSDALGRVTEERDRAVAGRALEVADVRLYHDGISDPVLRHCTDVSHFFASFCHSVFQYAHGRFCSPL